MENAKLIPTSSIFELILEKIPAAVVILQNEEIAYANESFLEFWVAENSTFDLSTKEIKIADFISKDSLIDFLDFLMDLDEEEHYFETILQSEDNEYTPVLVYGRISYDIDLNSLVSELDRNKFDSKVLNKDRKSTVKKSKRKTSVKKTRSKTLKKSTKSRKLSTTENLKPNHKNPLTLLVFVEILERMNAEFNIINLLNGVSDLVFMANKHKQITYANKSALHHLEFDNVSDVLGKKCSDLFNNVMCLPGICPLEEVIKTGTPQKNIQIKRNIENKELFYKANYAPLYDSDNTVSNYMITWKNVTDLHNHSDLIENMSEILQGIKDPILILNLLYEITYMNTSGLKLLGLNPTQFLILNSITIDIFKEPQNKIIKAAAEAVLRSKTPLNNQAISIMDSYNTQSHFLMSVIPMHDPNYNIDSIMIHLRDVTIEINAKKELGLLNEQIIAQNKQLKEYAYKLEQENIDLRNATNIEPVQESNNVLGEEGGKYTELEEGKIYLILEPKPKISYDVFLDQLSLKKPGLIISRHHPDSVRKKYNLAKTPIIWLNRGKTDEKKLYYQPNLELLAHMIKQFVKDSKTTGSSSILLIDGLEYLVIYNEFKKTLQFLELLNEIIMLHEGILLISLDKDIFDRKEFAFILRNSYLLDE